MITAIEITGQETDQELKDMAWLMLCRAHPHKAHAYDPEHFWTMFQKEAPGVSREEMLAMLKDTEEEGEKWKCPVCGRTYVGNSSSACANNHPPAIWQPL